MSEERGLTTEGAAVIALCAVGAAHVAWFGGWVVEDAAISFTYARNLAAGDGLVPFVGGERVEGYSNPTWVALLAVGELVGIDAYWAAKLAAMLCTTLGVVVVWRLAREATREAGWTSPTAPLAAAAAFAFNTQVGIFGAAGLENPLFSLLLGAGILLTARDPVGLRSAPIWALLAVTRPEGPVYAAIGAGMAIGAAVRARRAVPVLRWLGVFLAPLLVYHAIRYAYFAWPFPMTYYAKVENGPAVVWAWDGPGWVYVRQFATDTGQGWFLPLYLFGALGVLGWRGKLGFAAIALGAALILAPVGPIRPLGLLVVGVLPLLSAFGAGGNAVRVQCWAAGLVSVTFAVASAGDWMHGYRWMAMAAVPCAVLLAAGLAELEATVADLRGAGAAGVFAAVAAFAGLNIAHTLRFDDHREVSPFAVRKRVEAARLAVGRLHLDERARCFTVDMGGYMWWSGMELVDYVGLIDVPVAMNGRSPAVLEGYVFDEIRPHLLEIGHFRQDLRSVDALDRDYVHRGTFSLRRDLLTTPAWPWGGDPVALDGVDVVGVHVQSPEVAPGTPILVDVGLRGAVEKGFVTTVALLHGDERVASWRIEPGGDFLPPQNWRPDEIVAGRHALTLPRALPPGRYDVEVSLGRLGSALTTAQVVVVSPAGARAAAEADLEAARGLAADGRCADARLSWVGAQAHLYGNTSFVAENEAAADAMVARCWATSPDGADRVDRIERARRLSPDEPLVAEAVRTTTAELWAAGEQARSQGNWEQAYRAFADVVRLDPTRSWARRYAEEARGHLLAGPAGG